MTAEGWLLHDLIRIGRRDGLAGRPFALATDAKPAEWAHYAAGFKAGRNEAVWDAVIAGTACFIDLHYPLSELPRDHSAGTASRHHRGTSAGRAAPLE